MPAAASAPGTSLRYVGRMRSQEQRLVARLLPLSGAHPRYGYRRITAPLRAEGWRVNRKRVQRLWRQHGLKVPQKQRNSVAAPPVAGSGRRYRNRRGKWTRRSGSGSLKPGVATAASRLPPLPPPWESQSVCGGRGRAACGPWFAKQSCTTKQSSTCPRRCGL